MLAPAGSGVQSCHCAIYGNLRTQSEGQMFDLNEGDRAPGAPPRATTRTYSRTRECATLASSPSPTLPTAGTALRACGFMITRHSRFYAILKSHSII